MEMGKMTADNLILFHGKTRNTLTQISFLRTFSTAVEITK